MLVFPCCLSDSLSRQSRQVFLVGIRPKNLAPEEVSEEVPHRLAAQFQRTDDTVIHGRHLCAFVTAEVQRTSLSDSNDLTKDNISRQVFCPAPLHEEVHIHARLVTFQDCTLQRSWLLSHGRFPALCSGLTCGRPCVRPCPCSCMSPACWRH